MAASMIQRAFRRHLLKKAFKEDRNEVKETFKMLKAFKRARDRKVWRKVDLNKMTREQLRIVALTLNLPSTGKKVQLIHRIQKWIDQKIFINDVAVDAAAKALQKHAKGQGAVYFCEASIGATPFDILPLRGKNITQVTAVS